MGINCSTAYWGNWKNEGCQIGTRNKRFTAQFNGDGRCCVNTDVNNFSGYTGKPTFCFDNKWGQKFGAIDIPNDECRPSFEFIDKVLDVMVTNPQHIYQILTKRPERLLEWCKHQDTKIKKIGLFRVRDAPLFLILFQFVLDTIHICTGK